MASFGSPMDMTKILLKGMEDPATKAAVAAGAPFPHQSATAEIISVCAEASRGVSGHLVCFPPGTGKTGVAAELIRRLFRADPTRKIGFVCPGMMAPQQGHLLASSFGSQRRLGAGENFSGTDARGAVKYLVEGEDFDVAVAVTGDGASGGAKRARLGASPVGSLRWLEALQPAGGRCLLKVLSKDLRGLRAYLEEACFDVLILDEAHAYPTLVRDVARLDPSVVTVLLTATPNAALLKHSCWHSYTLTVDERVRRLLSMSQVVAEPVAVPLPSGFSEESYWLEMLDLIKPPGCRGLAGYVDASSVFHLVSLLAVCRLRLAALPGDDARRWRELQASQVVAHVRWMAQGTPSGFSDAVVDLWLACCGPAQDFQRALSLLVTSQNLPVLWALQLSPASPLATPIAHGESLGGNWLSPHLCMSGEAHALVVKRMHAKLRLRGEGQGLLVNVADGVAALQHGVSTLLRCPESAIDDTAALIRARASDVELYLVRTKQGHRRARKLWDCGAKALAARLVGATLRRLSECASPVKAQSLAGVLRVGAGRADGVLGLVHGFLGTPSSVFLAGSSLEYGFNLQRVVDSLLFLSFDQDPQHVRQQVGRLTRMGAGGCKVARFCFRQNTLNAFLFTVYARSLSVEL